jgi:hypothetical protein
MRRELSRLVIAPLLLSGCLAGSDGLDRPGEEACQSALPDASGAERAYSLAERKYEEFSSLTMPAAYDREALATWYEAARARRQEAGALYQEVVASGADRLAIAALSRMGEMSYSMMDDLLHAPLPTAIEVPGYGVVTLEGELKAELEAKLLGQFNILATPLREDARGALSRCVTEAAARGIKDPWSERCSELLVALQSSGN